MDYKALAQQTVQELIGYNQDTSGWKVVKTAKKITVYSKPSKKFLGNLYRVEGIIPESTSRLSDFLYKPENRVTWDKSLKVYNMVQKIDPDSFICHTITQSFAMGSVSPRDFIDLVYIKHCEGNVDVISYKLKSSSFAFRNPAHSKLVMFVQTEMKGKLSPSIVEATLPSNLISFILSAKDGIQVHRTAGRGYHHNGHSSFLKKK
ncbi:PREDICTED: stAR-related lipid transfer protein 6 [Condylura cristata]|uniref:stAR-related lipid transfer protein 6 n=1 Tax=Condylura cristata TaxID=143302 RepID=UPI0003344917|nr:PREDICTED: stAR-related lipid transfer protein 6 [Condylura cristata]